MGLIFLGGVEMKNPAGAGRGVQAVSFALRRDQDEERLYLMEQSVSLALPLPCPSAGSGRSSLGSSRRDDPPAQRAVGFYPALPLRIGGWKLKPRSQGK